MNKKGLNKLEDRLTAIKQYKDKRENKSKGNKRISVKCMTLLNDNGTSGREERESSRKNIEEIMDEIFSNLIKIFIYTHKNLNKL